VDWIPKCFPNYQRIIKNGLDLNIHTNFIPIAVTMKCHTARFLDEEQPEHCSKPCLNNLFELNQEDLGKKFLLHGNVVFRPIKITEKEVRRVRNSGFKNMIISLDQLSCIKSTREIDEIFNKLTHGV
jgi:hypothetical protein